MAEAHFEVANTIRAMYQRHPFTIFHPSFKRLNILVMCFVRCFLHLDFLKRRLLQLGFF